MIIETHTFSNIGEELILQTDLYTNVESVLEYIDVIYYSKPADSTQYTLDVNNSLTKQFSRSSDNETWSAYRDITDPELNSLSGDFYFRLKLTVDSLEVGNTITFESFSLSLKSVVGAICQTPNIISCDDPFGFVGGALIKVCDESTFNPYDLTKAVNIYEQLADVVSNTFGHTVDYIKVVSDQSSRDVILNEYSLYTELEPRPINILVPDNEFPSRDVEYTIFGIDFEEFEIHITFNEFSRVFGNYIPEEYDYMKIPQIDKVYEIATVSVGDEFNNTASFWKLKLRKWQNRSSIEKHEDNTIEDEILTHDKLFGLEIEKEFDHVTKPQEYVEKTIQSNIDNDPIRNWIDPRFSIEDGQITSNWTVIGRNYYTSDNTGNDLVVYDRGIDLNKDVVLTFFSRNSKSITDEVKVLETDQLNVYIEDNNIKLDISGDEFITEYDTVVDINSWYAHMITINRTFKEIKVDTFKLPEHPDKYSQSELVLSNTIVHTHNSDYNSETTDLKLLSTGYDITNVRVMNEIIDETEKINFFLQYTTYNSEYSVITDVANPQIKLIKVNDHR